MDFPDEENVSDNTEILSQTSTSGCLNVDGPNGSNIEQQQVSSQVLSPSGSVQDNEQQERLLRHLTDVSAADTKTEVQEVNAADKPVFSLDSQEEQDHLWELNEELKALNEQGSPKLSFLHGSTDVKGPGKKQKGSSRHEPSVQASRSKKPSMKIYSAASPATDDDVRPSNPNPVDEGQNYSLLSTAEDAIDRILEEKAWKANLTTVNVKNILRYVVTNEHVLAMVRNSMQSGSGEVGNTLTEAKYEPKLTRSKAKELIEKQAKVPWPISPIKVPTTAKSKSLIELEFSESDASSDEEYKPGTENVPSDDEESVAVTHETVSLEVVPHCSESLLDNEQESSADKHDQESGTDPFDQAQSSLEPVESEDTIALRTRSKLPLNDTPLESIEADFIAPDISADMYDSECDDEEWRDFLGQFLKPLDSNTVDVVDDDQNDPEYNFLEEEDVPDSEDLRDDRAVKISKKELHGLMAELFEEAEAELAEVEEDDAQSLSVVNSEISHSPMFQILNQNLQTHITPPVMLFNVETRQQLEEQLRKHVQLLAQTYILSRDVPGLKTLSEMCNLFLVEIQTLADKNAALYTRPSIFAAYNLRNAIDIISSYSEKISADQKGTEIRKWQKLSSAAMSTIVRSDVFMYPEILPQCGFRPPAAFKRSFVNAEDALLAMGLEQFVPLKGFSCWELIKEHMIPVKSVKQICIRAKNLRSAKYPANAVKYYYQHKCAPVQPRIIQPFDPEKVKAPFRHMLSRLPDWLKAYLTENPTVAMRSPVGKESIARPARPLLPAPSFVQVIPHIPVVSNPEMTTQTSMVPFDMQASGALVVPLGHDLGLFEKDLSTITVTNPAVDCHQPTVLSASVNAFNDGRSTSMPQAKTPEKFPRETPFCVPVATSFGTGQTVQRLSPLKRVSPIIKKYSQKRLRKTGGNLKTPTSQTLKKIMPKIIVSSVPSRPRSLAPKRASSNAPAPVFKMSCTDKRLGSLDVKNAVLDAGALQNKEALSASLEKSSPTCDDQFPDKDQLSHQAASNDMPIVDDAITAAMSTSGTNTSNRVDVWREQRTDLQPPDVHHESESEAEVEMFDDGEDTADDDPMDIQGDNEDDLAALMAASTTIKTTPRHRQNIMNKNKKLKDRKALLKILECDTVFSDPLKEERETAFVQGYLQRVKDVVGCNEKLFGEFLRLLSDFSGGSDRNAINLYKNICHLLKDFPDLCNDFVSFLFPEQAYECGKFMEFLSITKMQIFLKKLEAHFGTHPHHIQKIIKVLTHLHQQENLTMDAIKASVLPLFRGQQHLIEEFLQLFPDERPPESCMTDFEDIYVPDGEEEIVLDEDGFEVIELPETRDPYGGQDCICHCHVSTEMSKVQQSRLRHCVGCGIKFIDGRVFLQTGKVLKPCQISYIYPLERSSVKQVAPCASLTSVSLNSDDRPSPATHSKRLPAAEGTTQCVSPSSSMSSLSPSASKESDSEMECAVGNKTSPQDVAVEIPKDLIVDSKPAANRLLEVLEHISQDNTTTLNLPLPSDAVTEDAILTPDTSTHSGIRVPADFSILRSVINPPSTVCPSFSFEIHQSHRETAEGGMTVSLRDRDSDCDCPELQEQYFDKESDNIPRTLSKTFTLENRDTLSSEVTSSTNEPLLAAPIVLPHSFTRHAQSLGRQLSAISEQQMASSSTFVNAKNHIVDGKGHVVVLWTRESDRVLLQTCQQLGPSQEAFAEIAAKLQNKSQAEVAARFQELMTLFSQQTSKPASKSQKPLVAEEREVALEGLSKERM